MIKELKDLQKDQKRMAKCSSITLKARTRLPRRLTSSCAWSTSTGLCTRKKGGAETCLFSSGGTRCAAVIGK